MRPHKMLLILLLSAVLPLELSACGAGNRDMTASGQSSSSVPDGYLQTAGNRTDAEAAPGGYDYLADTKQVKDTVARLPGVEDSSIVMNGATAYVTLRLRDDVDLEQAMEIRNRAHAVLKQLMPRYEVRVSVGKRRVLQ